MSAVALIPVVVGCAAGSGVGSEAGSSTSVSSPRSASASSGSSSSASGSSGCSASVGSPSPLRSGSALAVASSSSGEAVGGKGSCPPSSTRTVEVSGSSNSPTDMPMPPRKMATSRPNCRAWQKINSPMASTSQKGRRSLPGAGAGLASWVWMPSSSCTTRSLVGAGCGVGASSALGGGASWADGAGKGLGAGSSPGGTSVSPWGAGGGAAPGGGPRLAEGCCCWGSSVVLAVKLAVSFTSSGIPEARTVRSSACPAGGNVAWATATGATGWGGGGSALGRSSSVATTVGRPSSRSVSCCMGAFSGVSGLARGVAMEAFREPSSSQ